MSAREIYQGTGFQLVDAKARVAIPASLRAAIAANTPAGAKDGPAFTLAAHPREKCLIGYDKGWAQLQAERETRREEGFTLDDGETNYNFKRKASGAGEEVGYDASGRFILPSFLRFYSRIKDHAFFYGVYDYFEIWDPQTLIDTPDAPEVMKEAARFFASEKGIAL